MCPIFVFCFFVFVFVFQMGPLFFWVPFLSEVESRAGWAVSAPSAALEGGKGSSSWPPVLFPSDLFSVWHPFRFLTTRRAFRSSSWLVLPGWRPDEHDLAHRGRDSFRRGPSRRAVYANHGHFSITMGLHAPSPSQAPHIAKQILKLLLID